MSIPSWMPLVGGVITHFEQKIYILRKQKMGDLGLCPLLVERCWSTSAEDSNSREATVDTGVIMAFTDCWYRTT